MPDNNTSRGVRSRRGRLSAAIDAERQARLEQSFISFDETGNAMTNVLDTSGGEALTQATLESALQSLRNQPGMSIRPTQMIVDESSWLRFAQATDEALRPSPPRPHLERGTADNNIPSNTIHYGRAPSYAWMRVGVSAEGSDVTTVRIGPAILDRLTPEQRAAYDAAANGIRVQQVSEITDRNGNRMLLNEAGQEREDL